MSESNNKLISALMDGEAEGNNDKLYDALLHDQMMRDTWSRYHLIADCLRNQAPYTISCQASSQVSRVVMQSLRTEPTVLAAHKTKRFLKPMLGFALAASVAMVAVFSVHHSNKIDPMTATPVVVASATDNDSSRPQLSKRLETQVLPASASSTDAPETVANQRLNNYLMNHNQYRSNGSMNGILPYVRLVAIESQE